MTEFETIKRTLMIDGYKVETYIKEITSANILQIEVGTNGQFGGDSGHGSRTYFKLKDIASTDLRVDGEDRMDDEVEIILGGDCELETFIEALEYAVKVLKFQHDIFTKHVNCPREYDTLDNFKH